MLNPKISTSKKQPKIPLNLKNPNISSSFSSSCSISSDVPSGCLRFLSNVSKNSIKNPKLTPKGSNFRVNEVKKGSNLLNLDDFTTKFDVKKGNNQVKSSNDSLDVVKVRKTSKKCRLFDEKSSGFGVKCSDNGRNLRKNSKRCDFSDEIGVKFNDNGKNLGKNSKRYDLSDEIGVKFNDKAKNTISNSKRYDLSDRMGKFLSGFEGNLGGSNEDFTPVNCSLIGHSKNSKSVKIVENDGKCDGVSRSPTPPPPIQSSVSPEIQCGLTSVVAATPTTCYAAGHVMSGVTDKRKCRPKGILTIGNNNLFGSCRPSGFRSEGDRRDSIVPCPIEASVCWISSPCDEKRSVDRDEKLLPFNLVGCSSSALSSLGFSSEVFNKSNCTMSTDVSSGSFMLYSDMSSEFRGVLGPSLDHLVRSPSPLSPVAMPDLEDSLGGGNLMQIPESNSSPCNHVLSRSWSECELDSVNISPSFEFNPLVKLDSSNDMNMACTPDTSDSLLRSSPEPDVRISWSETDELDCCRYLSDEDNTTDRP